MMVIFVDILPPNVTHSHSYDYNQIAKILRSTSNSSIYSKRSHLYNSKRKVHNGLCDNIFPDLIVEPKSTYDVSQIVKLSREINVSISIRSGGNSYVCSSLKNGKIFLSFGLA